jgi:hypothetical protein
LTAGRRITPKRRKNTPKVPKITPKLLKKPLFRYLQNARILRQKRKLFIINALQKCIIFRVFEAKLGLGDFRANLRTTFVVIIHKEADVSDSLRKFSVWRYNGLILTDENEKVAGKFGTFTFFP